MNNIDEFLESPFGPIFVIPAKARIHPAEGGTAFAGVTAFLTFCEIINFDGLVRSRHSGENRSPGI